MNIFYSSMLLNIFMIFVSGALRNTKTERQRYIIAHPSEKNPFTDIKIQPADVKTLLNFNQKSWTAASLTTTEVAQVQNTLNDNCTIEADSVITIPDQPIWINDPNSSSNGTATIGASMFLNDFPQCYSEVNNVDIFVVDTVLYTTIDAFSGLDIQNTISYVDTDENKPVPCNPHGTEVTSIITGNIGMIRSGNRIVRGIGVFNCNGSGFVSSLISAFSDVITHQNANLAIAKNGGQLRRTVVNLSGGGSASTVLDAAAKTLYTAGIPTFVAAGNNNQNACQAQSPARAAGVFAVGATTFPGNVPAWFTNFGIPCVDLYLPGDPVTAVNVYGTGTTQVSGTSFSTPQATAQGAMELNLDLEATTDAIYDLIIDRSVTALQPAGSFVGNQIQVMELQNACVSTPMFTAYVANRTNANGFATWFNATNPITNNTCVIVTAQLKTKGWASLGLRNSISSNITYIDIGAKEKKNKFLNQILTNGTVKTKAITKEKIVNEKSATTIQITQQSGKLLVSYYEATKSKPLMSVTDSQYYSEVAFGSSVNAEVKYTYGATC